MKILHLYAMTSMKVFTIELAVKTIKYEAFSLSFVFEEMCLREHSMLTTRMQANI
jgi:hypothetical protein